MKFCKMHGLGNDFILFQEELDDGRDYSALAQKLCDRHTGIGADGILVILPSKCADIKMRIINRDGSEPNMCGNGIRCFSRYVFEQNIINKTQFAIETGAGIIRPRLAVTDGKVTAITINMGKPLFTRSQIPMLGPEGSVVSEDLPVAGKNYQITSLVMGVPHTMVFVDQLFRVDVREVGPQIEHHPLFPKQTNVNFVEVVNDHELKVKTWERGAGQTLACGTGCCASAVAAFLNRRTGTKVTVHLELGDLAIEYGKDQTVYMSGPAEYVCQGEVCL